MMDRNLFNEMYSVLLELWPSSIITSLKDVSNGGGNLPRLFVIYESVDDKISDIKGYDYEDLNQINWAMYTALQSNKRANKYRSLNELNISEVYKIYIGNL